MTYTAKLTEDQLDKALEDYEDRMIVPTEPEAIAYILRYFERMRDSWADLGDEIGTDMYETSIRGLLRDLEEQGSNRGRGFTPT